MTQYTAGIIIVVVTMLLGCARSIGLPDTLTTTARQVTPMQPERPFVVTPAMGPTVPASTTFYRQSWAVVVGVNRFRDADIPMLNYAVNDARAVREALQRLGFPSQNITMLLDADATKGEIERMLSSVVRQKTNPEDRLLIFFATHGMTIPLPGGGEEGYILFHDTNPNDLPFTALSMSAFKDIGRRIPAKHILVTVDACYSGYSLWRSPGQRPLDPRYLELIAKKRVIEVLAAGRKDQPVIEIQGHGVFTLKLLDGLAGLADMNGDGIITGSELGTWMHPRVAQASDYKQDMQSGKLDGEGEFFFDLRPVNPPQLTVRATPPDSTISLKSDKGRWDYRPGVELERGLYEIVVTHPGCTAARQSVTIDKTDVTLDVTLNCKPPPPTVYKLTVRATPPDSTISLKSDKGGWDYRPGVELERGLYEIVLTHPGCTAARQSVAIDKTDVTLDVTLDCSVRPLVTVPTATITGKDWSKRVPTFYIDVKPVSNSEFLEFVRLHPEWKRSQIARDRHDGDYLKHWQGDETLKAEDVDRPVHYVSYYAADAYCSAAKKKLPELDHYRAATKVITDGQIKYDTPYTPPDFNFKCSLFVGCDREWTDAWWSKSTVPDPKKRIVYKHGTVHNSIPSDRGYAPEIDNRHTDDSLGFRCAQYSQDSETSMQMR